MAVERDVSILLGHNLVEVLPAKREVVLQVVATGEHVRVGYDLLHVTPPMGPIPAIKESDVSNAEVSGRRGVGLKGNEPLLVGQETGRARTALCSGKAQLATNCNHQ